MAVAPMDGDAVIQTRTPDSFLNTNLQDELQRRGVHRLVLTGMQTEMCVDTTCRRAFSLGYDVVLVKDAHSTWGNGRISADDIIDHHNKALRWFAEVESADDVSF